MNRGQARPTERAVRITFGMIVLNGMPFVRYNLRALYPHAHQIVVVEGACPSARSIASPTGHSTDGTLEELARFQRVEDPERKVVVVTAEDDGSRDGFWLEKDEMSRAWTRRASGNVIWQVDSDEFYLPEDIEHVRAMLEQEEKTLAVSFPMLTFWGSPDVQVDGFFVGPFTVDRVFRWARGYSYSTHRPPTVLDSEGRNLKELGGASAATMRRRGIFMHHYELLLPKQVEEKCAYYRDAAWTESCRGVEAWRTGAYERLGRPFHVHMIDGSLSWLVRYGKRTPPEVVRMMEDVRSGQFPGIEARPMADVSELLSGVNYPLAAMALSLAKPLVSTVSSARRHLGRVARRSRAARWAIARVRGAAREGRAGSRPVIPGRASDLLEGWRDSSLPSMQREIVESELRDARAGHPHLAWAGLAEAMRQARCREGLIAEVGCGTGHLREALEILLGRRLQYLGMDYSFSFVRAGRGVSPSTPFLVADAGRLPLGDGACDVLLSGSVLLHVDDWREAIGEASRVSKGWVVFYKTPLIEGPTRRFKKLAYGVPCLETHFNRREFEDECSRCGLSIEEEWHVSGTRGDQCRTLLCRLTKDPRSTSRAPGSS